MPPLLRTYCNAALHNSLQPTAFSSTGNSMVSRATSKEAVDSISESSAQVRDVGEGPSATPFTFRHVSSTIKGSHKGKCPSCWANCKGS